MSDSIELGLAHLKDAGLGPDRDLGRLEGAVWTRIDARRDAFGGRTFQVQLAVSCGALLVGLAIAQFAVGSLMPRSLSSEMVVLSDDGAMAPSVRLEGGF